ncbi:MAG: histidine kinase [Cyclobacteriaceae bacterium]
MNTLEVVYDLHYEWVQTDTLSGPDQAGSLPASAWQPMESMRLRDQTYWVRLYVPELTPEEEYYIYYTTPIKALTVYDSLGSRSLTDYGSEYDEGFQPGKKLFRLYTDRLYDGNYVYLRVEGNHYRLYRFLFKLYDKEGTVLERGQAYFESYFWYNIFVLMFAGAVIIAFLYVFSIWVYDRKAVYLYYLLYLVVLGTYLFSRSYLVYNIFTDEIVPYYPNFQHHLQYTSQYLAHFAYLQFSLSFLDARRDYPVFYKWGRIASYVFFGAVILSVINIEFFGNYRFNYVLMDIERAIAIIATIVFQVIIFVKRKNELVLFVVIGSVFFILGAILAVVFRDTTPMRIGTLLEILLFSLGLAYRIKIMDRERGRYKDEMLKKAKEKRKLLEEFNTSLQQQVKERSEELVSERMKVQEQEKQVLQLSLEREIDRVKMIALRSQMNPHFLFNAINSIRAMIIREEAEQAYDYLMHFSKLIRYILESSESQSVALKEELRILKIYVSLEQMRLGGELDFTIEIGEGIDAETATIPPLILQPFLENALIHGLTTKEGEKQLRLSIHIEGSDMVCEVRDNGIGRQAAGTFKPEQKKKSMAIMLTEQRLRLLNEAGGKDKEQRIMIHDLTDENNEPAGTSVMIRIPLKKEAIETTGHHS